MRSIGITGGIVGGLAAGILIGVGSMALNDDKTRKRMLKNRKRAMRRASHFFDDFRDMF